MKYTLTQNSSLKTEGFFKKICENLFFTTVFITGVICTNYALDRLFSIYPSLPHEVLKVVAPVMAEAEKEMISQLVRRDVERAIRVGEEQIAKGQYKVLDDDFINQFVARMAKKFLPKHS